MIVLKNIILEDRLDIFVKIIYIKGFLKWNNFKISQKLYQKHILLFNGWIEDHKKNIQDFENDFQNLIKSIQDTWFDTTKPILVTPKWAIINWAHRVACCLYLWIEPTFKIVKENSPTIWDSEWFESNFTSLERLHIIYTLSIYIEDCNISVYWPSVVNQNFVKNLLKDEGIKYYGSVNIKLSTENLIELIKDIYTFDENISLEAMEEKAISMCKKDMEILIVISSQFDKRWKNKLRKMIIEKKYTNDLYKTFHSHDTINEKKYLKQIIHPNNIDYLLKRSNLLKWNFSKLLNWLKIFLIQKNIDNSEVCIVWSGPLWLYNLSNVSDIDIIEKHPTNHGIIKIGDIDILDYEYSNEKSNNEIITQEENHILYRWLKFIDFEILKWVKKESLRKKDIEHYKKIVTFTGQNNNINLKFYFYIVTKRIKINFINISIRITKKIGIYRFVSRFWRKYILKNVNEK